jgi:hypothetical protein
MKLMRKIQMLAVVLATTMATACVRTDPAFREALRPSYGMGYFVECDSGCKPEWERAQLWLAKHSSMKVQIATDVMLETYNSTGYDPVYSFTVTKEPAGGGRYRIAARLTCGNPLGCDPNAGDIQDAYLYYVKTGKDVLAGQRYGSAIR